MILLYLVNVKRQDIFYSDVYWQLLSYYKTQINISYKKSGSGTEDIVQVHWQHNGRIVWYCLALFQLVGSIINSSL